MVLRLHSLNKQKKSANLITEKSSRRQSMSVSMNLIIRGKMKMKPMHAT